MYICSIDYRTDARSLFPSLATFRAVATSYSILPSTKNQTNVCAKMMQKCHYMTVLLRQCSRKWKRTSICKRAACSIPTPLTIVLNVGFQNKLKSNVQFDLKMDAAFNIWNDIFRFTALTIWKVQQFQAMLSGKTSFGVYRVTKIFILVLILHCSAEAWDLSQSSSNPYMSSEMNAGVHLDSTFGRRKPCRHCIYFQFLRKTGVEI